MKKKILQIVDVKDWAIGTLANGVMRENPQFEWRQIAVHPRALEYGEIDLLAVQREILWADVIDAQYWRTLSQLLEKIPELKEKLVLLTHHNEKNLTSYAWTPNVWHIAKTRHSEKKLKEAGYQNITYIPNSFNPDVYQWNAEYPPKAEKPVVGYVGRIVAWKGLKEIAKACRELGYTLLFMGKPDDNDYLASIPEEDQAVIDWSYMNCTDEEKLEFYRSLTLYCGNSRAGREVGTLGFIEALACGVPVVTTPSGLAMDIGRDRENMRVVPFDDYEALRDAIKEVAESTSFAGEIRTAGWQTIKNLSDGQMGIAYGRVFYQMLAEDSRPWVSVVIPATYERSDLVARILNRLQEQSYKNIEAVVVWDEWENYPMPEDYGKVNFPIVNLFTDKKEGYNLAMARNIGTIHSGGDLLLFCDSRMLPEIDSIEKFVSKMEEIPPDQKVWMFGDKGADKRTFVENFSMIRRQDLINFGMFNERVTEYGAMSQELRSRALAQQFELIYVPEAKASQMCKTSWTPERRRSVIRMKELMTRLNFVK